MTASTRTVARLGFWSALLIAVTFVLFMVSFIAIAMNAPIHRWTNLTNYLEFVETYGQTFQHLARASMVAFSVLFVILLNVLYDFAPPEKKLYARIALSFGLGFAILSGLHYFVQITSVRLSIAAGQTQGLEQFVQANPTSGIAGMNMLGWTIFLGLASLFIAPIFSGSRLQRVIAIAFAVNGVMCLLGGVGYFFQIDIITFLTLNFGLGGAVMVASIGLVLLFRQANT